MWHFVYLSLLSFLSLLSPIKRNVLSGKVLNFKVVFDRYFRALVLFAERYLGCREESESIVQDTFVFLWEKPQQFTNEAAMKSWLYTTVRNKALNVLKHRKVQLEFTRQQLQKKESEVYYMQSLIEEETRRLLFAAIDVLPEQCRRVCLLNLDGLDNHKIAEVMGISLDTVKFHKKNAYRLLREKMRRV